MRMIYYILILSALMLAAAFGYYSFTGHDILSVASGGGTEITVNPNEVAEGNIPVDQPPTTTPPGGGGTTGGGGGGGAAYVPPTATLEGSPTSFDINLAVNTNIQKTINVKNLKTTSANISISQ